MVAAVEVIPLLTAMVEVIPLPEVEVIPLPEVEVIPLPEAAVVVAVRAVEEARAVKAH